MFFLKYLWTFACLSGALNFLETWQWQNEGWFFCGCLSSFLCSFSLLYELGSISPRPELLSPPHLWVLKRWRESLPPPCFALGRKQTGFCEQDSHSGAALCPCGQVQVAGWGQLQLAQPREGCGDTAGGGDSSSACPWCSHSVGSHLSREGDWVSPKSRLVWRWETPCAIQMCHCGLCRAALGPGWRKPGCSRNQEAEQGLFQCCQRAAGHSQAAWCPSCRNGLWYLCVTEVSA